MNICKNYFSLLIITFNISYFVQGGGILANPKAALKLYSSQWNGNLTYQNSFRIPRNNQIKMIIHGYNGKTTQKGYRGVIDNYLTLGHSVITVDYPQSKSYVDTFRSLPDLANYLAHFIKWINVVNVIPVENIHIIGFSLGGQIAGMTGELVDNLLLKKIARITALNPTRIGFESVLVPAANKLDPSDAVFVDVVHTDFRVSIVDTAGHVDFYPNGGSAPQPGCTLQKPKMILPEIPEDDGWEIPITIDGLCSHALSRKLFTDSILSDTIKATKCESQTNYEEGLCDGNEEITFGENTNQLATGKFYFQTAP